MDLFVEEKDNEPNASQEMPEVAGKLDGVDFPGVYFVNEVLLDSYGQIDHAPHNVQEVEYREYHEHDVIGKQSMSLDVGVFELFPSKNLQYGKCRGEDGCSDEGDEAFAEVIGFVENVR